MAALRVASPLQQNRLSKSSIGNARPFQRCVLARDGAVTVLKTIEEYNEFIDHEGVVVVDFFVSIVFSQFTLTPISPSSC